MSDYHPNLDGPAEPYGLSIDANGNPKQSELPSSTGSDTPFLDEICEIHKMRDDAKFALEKLIRKRGWKHTSDTPGCQWLWEKKLSDGRIALVSLETAVDFETEMCGEHYQDLGG